MKECGSEENSKVWIFHFCMSNIINFMLIFFLFKKYWISWRTFVNDILWSGFYRLLLKGIFDAYMLWPFDKNFIFELVMSISLFLFFSNFFYKSYQNKCSIFKLCQNQIGWWDTGDIWRQPYFIKNSMVYFRENATKTLFLPMTFMYIQTLVMVRVSQKNPIYVKNELG